MSESTSPLNFREYFSQEVIMGNQKDFKGGPRADILQKVADFQKAFYLAVNYNDELAPTPHLSRNITYDIVYIVWFRKIFFVSNLS